VDAKVHRTDGVELKICQPADLNGEDIVNVAKRVMQVVGINFSTLDARERRKIFIELLALYKVPDDVFYAFIESTYEP
jgi:hypothetical protein